MKKVYVVTVLCVAVMIASFLFGKKVYTYYRYHSVKGIEKADLDKLNLEGYNKLMIVAHPDDESLWGGAHLLRDDYLVVCLTNKSNEVRNKEFSKAMEYSKDKYIMLDYPDKIYNKRSNWDENIEKEIVKDVKTLLEYKNWDLVVTHNKNGEYGHQHHKSTHKFVTKALEEENQLDKVKYFGQVYYNKVIAEHLDELTPIGDETLVQRKDEMCHIYKSQACVDASFSKNIPYEFSMDY